MAIVKTGNALTTALQQPGSVVSNDGYGLLTSSVSWTGNEGGTPILKGSDHPEFAFMKAWKIAREYRSLEYVGYKVDYVGICSEADGEAEDPGLWTEATNTIANISGAASLASEGITSHPSFFDGTVPFGGADDLFMIAGHGTGTPTVPVYAASTIVTTEFVGLNGAHFKKPPMGGTGYVFTGFKDPTYMGYFGKSNYLAPTTGLSGIIYTSSEAVVQKFLENVGHSSLLNGWVGGPLLVPTFVGEEPDFEGPNGAMLLLSGVNFEQYGHVYKCSYQIRINKEGWPQAVYPLFTA
jgi:hypothetical protein